MRARKWAVFSRRRVAELVGALDQVESPQAGADDRRRDAVREQVRPSALPQQLDDLAAAGDVAAARAADRLAERAGEDVHAVEDAVVLVRPAPARADHADGVRVVDHHERVVPVGEVADPIELCKVAVHREDTVGCDQPVARVRGLLELRLELVHVAVRVSQPSRLAEPDPVDDRSVVELIGDDRVPLVEERLEQTAVRVEAGAEQNRVVGAEERGELLLELPVQRLRAADEADRGHPVAPALERLVRCRDDRRMAREAQVVVRAEVEQLAPFDVHVRTLRRGHHELGLVEPRRRAPRRAGVDRSSRSVPYMVPPTRRRPSRGSPCPTGPTAMTAKASSKSRCEKRCVITGLMSSPDWSMTVIWYQVSYISRP